MNTVARAGPWALPALPPQAPAVFLELNRKLRYQEEYFSDLASLYGYEKWGQWWLSANSLIEGKSPIELRATGALSELQALLQKETQRRVACLREQIASDEQAKS